MIEINHFSKKYGKREAVTDFSLLCNEGEITAILGANGAGKTTILKAVCARHFATAGSVRVCGVDAQEQPSSVRVLTGFVEENANLPEELFVREFLAFRAELFSRKSEDIERVKKSCMLDEIWNEKIHILSKGQKERVNFAQALIHDPRVLVLDEPMSGLDPAQIVRMRKLILSLKKGRTILLSTHLMQEVDALSDKICVLSRGKSVAFGTAKQIVEKAQSKTIEEAFFSLTSEGL